MLLAPAGCLRVQRTAIKSITKRGIADLYTNGRNAAVSHGPPGRSATTGHVATVFGCTGFLGRYLVSKLAKSGTQVIVPYREEDSNRVFKPMGDLGQIVPMEFDLRNESQVAECLRHSNIVYNLVGRDYETKNFNFDAVHVKGAETIARIAAQEGVSRFVHVSHLNASPDSKSKYYQTKAYGEVKVREQFPTATIVRPAALFGYEDRLLNSIANWPIWWQLNHAKTKVRPAHVMDVAQALTNVLTSSEPLPGTYSLPGPSQLTYEYLLELVSSVTYRPPSGAPVLPKAIALALARVSDYVWWPSLSADQVERRYIDDVEVEGDWAAFGIQPEEIESLAISYLRRYRSSDNYVRPVVFPESRAHLPTSIPHSRMGL